MLMTISAAAKELGCSPDHIRRMIKADQWPHYRLGVKALRIDVEEIKKLSRLLAEAEKRKGRISKENII